jgi:hypothetical protein
MNLGRVIHAVKWDWTNLAQIKIWIEFILEGDGAREVQVVHHLLGHLLLTGLQLSRCQRFSGWLMWSEIEPP